MLLLQWESQEMNLSWKLQITWSPNNRTEWSIRSQEFSKFSNWLIFLSCFGLVKSSYWYTCQLRSNFSFKRGRFQCVWFQFSGCFTNYGGKFELRKSVTILWNKSTGNSSSNLVNLIVITGIAYDHCENFDHNLWTHFSSWAIDSGWQKLIHNLSVNWYFCCKFCAVRDGLDE